MLIRVIGAGVAGLTAAFEIARAGAPFGAEVELIEKAAEPGCGCSYYAGGMIAPWCELQSAEPVVAVLGEEALAFWTKDIPVATIAGSLVVAPPRDRAELADFTRRTHRFERLDEAGLAVLEPALAGRFSGGLYFREEAHLEPRAAMRSLFERLQTMDMFASGSARNPRRGRIGPSTAAAFRRATSWRNCAASRARCWCCAARRSNCPAPCACCIRAIRSMSSRAGRACSWSARR